MLPSARAVPDMALAAAMPRPADTPRPAEPFTVSLTACFPDFSFLAYFTVLDTPYNAAPTAAKTTPPLTGVSAVEACRAPRTRLEEAELPWADAPPAKEAGDEVVLTGLPDARETGDDAVLTGLPDARETGDEVVLTGLPDARETGDDAVWTGLADVRETGNEAVAILISFRSSKWLRARRLPSQAHFSAVSYTSPSIY